jgi:hypothetical protein
VIYAPEKYKKSVPDFNQELLKLKGELEPKEARITLAKFLYQNIGLTVFLLCGVRLYPDQIINLKGMLNSNYSLCVMSRGLGKTYLAAIFCILQCIFYPESKIVIAGPGFRTSRFIFDKIQEMANKNEAVMLYQALGIKIGNPQRKNDGYVLLVNGGSITSIPSSQEKVRGFRANVLIIDEFLLVSQDIIEKVLLPFLAVPQDLTERQAIRSKEDQLIRKGVLKEEDRMAFFDSAKLIGLSSASYDCEYLAKEFDRYVQQIYSPDMPENKARYFLSQMAWNSVHPDRMDKNVIEMANSNEANQATFKREWGAQFTSGSEGYFSMSKMMACTVPDGEHPTLLLSGDKNKKYVLSIDPNFSNSPTGDDFAMTLIEIDDDNFKNGKISGTVVHNYARHGKNLKDHIHYFFYLWTNFNIEMICIDYAGYQFIESANESEFFKKINVEFKIFEFYAEKDGAELEEQLKLAKRNYNKTINRIVFTQLFTTDSIRKINEYLQGCIDFKRIWFGAGIKGDGSTFEKTTSSGIDLSLTGAMEGLPDGTETERKQGAMIQLIDNQELLLKQQKYQCASIEVKTTAKGTQSFDLPQLLKRNVTATRMRKDLYTTLVLSNWCLKQYYEILNIPKENNDGFTPVLV